MTKWSNPADCESSSTCSARNTWRTFRSITSTALWVPASPSTIRTPPADVGAEVRSPLKYPGTAPGAVATGCCVKMFLHTTPGRYRSRRRIERLKDDPRRKESERLLNSTGAAFFLRFLSVMILVIYLRPGAGL